MEVFPGFAALGMRMKTFQRRFLQSTLQVPLRQDWKRQVLKKKSKGMEFGEMPKPRINPRLFRLDLGQGLEKGLHE